MSTPSSHWLEKACCIAIVSVFGAAMLACHSEEKLAMVNGKTVTKAQFDAFLAVKRITPKDDKQQTAVLTDYLEREALADTIASQGLLDKTLTDAELNEFRKQMLISRYFDKFLSDVVTDDAVLNYYNTHAESYQRKKAKVAHILFRTTKSMDEASRQVKLTTAQEAYSKLRSGEDFAAIAKAYSEDAVSSKKGGDLGWISEGGISKRFSDKVFALSKDAITEPFETSFGFHIVKLLEAPTVVKQPFDAVKGRIRHELRTQAKGAELKRLLDVSSIEQTM